MELEPPTTAPRHRRILIGIAIVTAFGAGCFIGGVAAAAARDSVASSSLTAAQRALEACQAREVVQERVTERLQLAFDDLAADDPVSALTHRAVAAEYLDYLSAQPPCTFDD